MEKNKEDDKPDYDVDDFVKMSRALHDNDIQTMTELLSKATPQFLQAMVDVGDNMLNIARKEAKERHVELFTPWRSYYVVKKS